MRTFYKFRVDILELAARLEVAMDSVIAASFCRSASAAAELSVDVLSALSVERRIKAVSQMLERFGLKDQYPFVVPVLRKLFELRNTFAHNLDDLDHDPASGSIALIGLRSGRPQRFEIDYLDWLLAQSRQVHLELSDLYWRVAPQDPRWHDA